MRICAPCRLPFKKKILSAKETVLMSESQTYSTTENTIQTLHMAYITDTLHTGGPYLLHTNFQSFIICC